MPDSQLPPPPSIQEDPDQVIFSARDLAFELMVTKAILRSLSIDQMLYVVLSGVTSGEGLGFNRGLFLLADDGQRSLRTAMAVGPIHRQEAHRIWEDMVEKSLTLEALLTVYDAVKDDPSAHQLSHRLRHLNLTLDALPTLAAQCLPPSQVGRARIEPMIAKSLLERRPLHSRSLELICDSPDGDEAFAFRNWWIVPLLTPERIVGTLVVDDAFSNRDVPAGVQHLLVALANLSAIAVEKSKLFDEMRALAQVDGLTGLANRRSYEKALHRHLTQSRQTGRDLSLIVFDLDHFKQFNDRWGHLAGDDALRFVAQVFRTTARKTDLIARYGGEEFVLLLPDTSFDQAWVVAEKMVAAVRDQSTGSELGSLTVCAGVANTPDGRLDANQLFEKADAALYRAKNNGRNRVEGTPPS